MNPNVQEILQMYRTMTMIRQSCERVRSMVLSGEAMLLVHMPWGEEAISAGISAHLRSADTTITTYRGMGDELAKGVPLKALWSEYLGKATGPCKGKGGPMHITYPEAGLMVTTGIVGSGIPIANGFAIASQLRGDDLVTVVNFGDGATNIGAFHEALNMAQLWKLPVIFLCHNNLWGEHTAIHEHQENEHVADRAAAYGMEGITVDGTDPIAVWEASKTAIERARAGKGPTLIEAVAPRLAGHYVGDAMKYQPEGWLEKALETDPVVTFRARILQEGHATEEALSAIESEIRAELDEAVEFAKNSPDPDVSEIEIDIYSEVAA
ncbi:thiamine pyrophosphate-dependent dehydrogenase E1 component subunit alpha [Parasphingorhabdus sp.]|uniref:thiamine pyrophosphate-dependent dehydrogenase E1 component subunit alpha n=1 Tax=Parasphingorhabdus sp. TaxID=2709688 RepID=UPI003A8DA4AC